MALTQVKSDGIATGAVTATQIAANAVTVDDISDGSISTAKLADDAVTADKLADTAVTAGSYGSASAIPAITVDAQGRITAASTNAISVESDRIFEGNTSAEAVDTGSDGHFKVVTEGSEQLRVDNSGRLIVGATSESESSLLSITGSTGGSGDTASIFLRNGLADGSVLGSYALGRLRFGNAGGECARIDTQSEDSFSASSRPGRLMFLTTASGSTTPTERMRINSSGDIGINGTTNPNYPLTFANTGSRGAGIDYNSGVSDTNLDIISLGKGTGWLGQIRFFTSASSATATERMRITSDGYVGFGATARLDQGGIFFRPNSSNGAGEISWNRADTASTSYILTFYNNSSAVGYISHNNTTTTYSTSSDYRLKENVVPLTGAADRLNQLQVRRFNFIADPDTTVDGFIAHEAQAVVPECVTGTHNEVEVWKEGEELPNGFSVGDNKLDEDGNTIPVYQGIDQSKLVPLLTAALQEALAKIETLETRLTALEA